jgi:hypothetical protein
MATGGRINAGETLTLNLSGLPYHSRALRDAGIGLGAIVLAVGLWVAFAGAPAGRGPATQLKQRREKLFADLVALEDQRKRGRIDDTRYATRREALVGQLERVMGELDEGPQDAARAAS